MKASASHAATKLASRGGDEVHAVTLVSEPALVGESLWLIKVRLLMQDGASKAFECNSTEREVFSVREVPPG